MSYKLKEPQLIDLLVGSIISGRDAYEKAYDEAIKEAERASKKARGEYIGSRLSSELEAIENNKTTTIQKARDDVREAVNSRALAIRSAEMKAVTDGSHTFTALKELESIGQLPVSAIEFESLCARYKECGYWTAKMLNNIAERNGIPYACELSIDEKLGIVSDLVEGFSDYLDFYQGHGKTPMEDDKVARAFASVSDNALTRAAYRYIAGQKFDVLSDDRVVGMACDGIKSCGDSYGQGMKLRNVLRNSNDNIRNALLLRLVGDSSISDGAFKLAGIDTNEIKANMAERMSDYQKCGEKLQALKKSSNMVEDMTAYLQGDRNGYLAAMITSEARSNDSIKSAAVEIGLAHDE